MEKTADAFRTISEVAQDLDLPQHVLRFWETRFTQIKPLKRGGGRRYYRREDIELLRAIRQLLYDEGYTIKGVQKILKEQGARGVVAAGRREAPPFYDALPDEAPEPSDYSDTQRGLEQSRAEPLLRNSAEYEVLEQVLTELGECERLLGAARAN
jgi:DNA-binding transcriptional MerR regulator